MYCKDWKADDSWGDVEKTIFSSERRQALFCLCQSFLGLYTPLFSPEKSRFCLNVAHLALLMFTMIFTISTPPLSIPGVDLQQDEANSKDHCHSWVPRHPEFRPSKWPNQGCNSTEKKTDLKLKWPLVSGNL